MTQRKCRYLGDGVIACGGKPTAQDLEEVEKMKRYLRGEMNLREAREFDGLSVGQAAKLAGLTVEKVRALESGEVVDEIATRKLWNVFGPEAKRV